MLLNSRQEFRPNHVHESLECKVTDSAIAELDEIEDSIHQEVKFQLAEAEALRGGCTSVHFGFVRNMLLFHSLLVLLSIRLDPDEGELALEDETRIKATFGEQLLDRFMNVLHRPDVFKSTEPCTNPRHKDLCCFFFFTL